MLRRLRAVGPGALAAAAFIGPGTVTTATIAGARYGFSLVWALVFATLAAMTLHEMAVRLGAYSKRGLGEAIIEATASARIARRTIAGLIFAALLIGNAAYEGGNIAGAALGVEAAFASINRTVSVAAIIALAAAILFLGGYKLIERCLVAIVILMSVCFLATFVAVRPDLGALAAGLVPAIPAGGVLVVIGLIGTTIVPYNLFLHAAAAKERWAQTPPDEALANARFDATLSIGVGGLVSILILSTAAASFFGSETAITNAGDMARQLEPVFGPASRYLMAAGLFAAGLSSAITAPLATGYAVSELLARDASRRDTIRQITMLVVLTAGALAALSGAAPISIIVFAQVANGILLPVIGVFLLYAVNRRALLAEKTNNLSANVIGAGVLVLTALLGARALYGVVARFI
ncbi:MAG: Nramp family divalent metal transporter [Pseudomonadota bacterium]